MSQALTVFRTSRCHLNFNAQLSTREFEMCEQVILGNTQIEASEIFFRSPYTISQTIRNAFRKTGARNISELGVWYWCRKYNATMILSAKKRIIITAILLVLFAMYDFAPVKADMLRSCRTVTRTAGRRKDDTHNHDYLQWV